MATTDELMNQFNTTTASPAVTPSVSSITKPKTTANLMQQFGTTDTDDVEPDNLAPDNVIPIVDTNINPPADTANYNDMSQMELQKYYQQKFPRLFDKEGNIVDIEAAQEAGILSNTRTIVIDSGDDVAYHYPSSQRTPWTELSDKQRQHYGTEENYNQPFMSYGTQYVEQPDVLSGTEFLFDSPSQISSNSEQYAYDAERDGKTRGEIVYIDAADTEKAIDALAEKFLPNVTEQEAREEAEQTFLLDIPADVSFGLNPGASIAESMQEITSEFESIDWENPSPKFERALEDARQKLARDDALEYMIDGMEEGDLKKVLKILGPSGLDSLMTVGNTFGWVGAKYGDGVQRIAETAQYLAPDMYDALDIGTPEEVADEAMYITGGIMESMDALIPTIGTTMKLPTKIAQKSAKLSIAIDKDVLRLSKATDADEIAKLNKRIADNTKKLNKSTSEELDILDAQDSRKVVDTIMAAETAWNKKLNAAQMRGATDAERALKQEDAAKVAAENADIAEELIDTFEAATGKTIHTVVDGKKIIDPDKARAAGVETAEDVMKAQQRTTKEVLSGDATIDITAAPIFGQGDEITQPLLKPEKFNALVATIADLKQNYPDAFEPKQWKAGPRKGQDYTVIDHLFELTVNKQLVAGDELIDMLNKYDISFEDYILTVVGSGSEAGKVLQKLSMIKRARPTNEMLAMQEAKTLEAQGEIRRLIMRVENIRRGGLVSQIATASRNLTSAFIRAPLEGLGNVMDTALYNTSKQGYAKGAVSLLSPNNWRDSFRHMKYIFSDENKDVKDVVEFMLEHPELHKQYELLFNNINEIQRATGRVDEMIFDFSTVPGNRIDMQTTMDTAKRLVENITDPGLRKAAYERFRASSKLNLVLSAGEDGVEVLNSYNRWQEFLVRRGTFLAELERLTKREYGIDLIDTLKAGKIRDLLNDSTDVRPADARPFANLVEDATNKALDVTYAKQPNIPLFRSASSFIVRNGGTVAFPFPRFMFNSLELMGQYAGGASIPLAKKVAGVVTGKRTPLNAKDRERISRNLVGMGVTGPLVGVTVSSYFEEGEEQPVTDGLLDLASIAAAYQYRTMDGAPADYKIVNGPDGSVVDITPQYPLRQFMWMGEATKRMRDGTFDTWFDAREFYETFLGTNVRTGVGKSILEDAVNAYAGEDLTSEEAQGKFWGGIVGNYLSTWAVPFAQIIEAERMDGSRGLVVKDASEDPTLDGEATFMNELVRPFRQRGFLLTPEEEADLPLREYLFREEARRVSPASKIFLGLSFRTGDEEYGEYLTSLGFTDFELGSRSRVPSIRNFENKVLRDAVPIIVEIVQEYEETLRSEYQSNPLLKERYTENEYVTDMVRPIIKGQISEFKANITDDKGLMADAPDYIVPMLKFRRLGPDVRRASIAIFISEFGRQPDGSSSKDLSALATIGETYKSAIR